MATPKNTKISSVLAAFAVALMMVGPCRAETASAGESAIEEARRASDANPASAQLKFQHAEALRKAGHTKDALKEFLAATEIDPALYVAYHQITLCSPDEKSLAEAVKRLNFLMTDKPKELMLRVALSELFEKQGNYYQASRTLVDLVYQNAVASKYQAKINARIHYLLTKAKDAQHTDQPLASEEELDALPPPLPESSLGRDLAHSKLKESKVMRAVGNAPLLP